MTTDPMAADAPAIGVVIPVHDAGAQLAALAAQEVPVGWEVVVADNDSTDAAGSLHEHALYLSE